VLFNERTQKLLKTPGERLQEILIRTHCMIREKIWSCMQCRKSWICSGCNRKP